MSTALPGAARPSGPGPRVMNAAAARRLAAMLQRGGSGAVVQLVAANPAEGTSSLARDLALAAAVTGARVMLLDLDQPSRRQITTLAEDFALPAIADQSIALAGIERPAYRIGSLGLHAMEIDTDAEAISPHAWREFYQNLLGQNLLGQNLLGPFDLVIIDSAPLSLTSDCILRAPMVQTNLIVLRAEKTRIAVAQNLRDRIAEAGGPIGGVVFNRRRFHVPAMLYRRL
jgi:Mrp family chromosome partitioning ATPase